MVRVFIVISCLSVIIAIVSSSQLDEKLGFECGKENACRRNQHCCDSVYCCPLGYDCCQIEISTYKMPSCCGKGIGGSATIIGLPPMKLPSFKGSNRNNLKILRAS